MKKRFACGLLSLLLFAALVSPAAAHSHSGDTPAPTPLVSDWAKEEVSRARELQLLSRNALWIEDYRKPITRGAFLDILMQYLSVQQNCDILSSLANYTLSGVTEGGDENAATAMGLIQGYADGNFHPEGLITRRTAALLLTRAYQACGGTLPGTTPSIPFTDEATLSEEVRQSAAALASWNVMQGKTDGSFAPGEYYTVEQCIVTFLRLYENAPLAERTAMSSSCFPTSRPWPISPAAWI